ncbi:polysaccharide pyruvyl transferase family protein [Hahella chejuensis KCTC 2396]|uniref:Polysaccharide pyruvyl transferase family protein n=1 Tax=Hahella chejuensis (strain KCTC 2396) TaxID=349521 RepID=Q2SIK8_HAHCH|nr:polysaccharide pyruvyl transferase family protein [Hahella chejuensis]ABC29516.1 polysaccharide pyruvyl transferase family protein [Hahella chejuensis KCTC 2396]
MEKKNFHVLHAHASRENVGDDAIVIAIQKILQRANPDQSLSYTTLCSDNRSREKFVTNYMHLYTVHSPSKWINLLQEYKNADLVVIGGGELICGALEYLMLLPLAKIFRIPIVFLGVGADRHGMSFLTENYTRHTLKLADKILVRDNSAYEVIKSFNTPSEKINVTADVVFALYKDRPIEPTKSGIGVCLRSTQRDDRALTRERLEVLAQYITKQSEELNCDIHLFPFIPYATDASGSKLEIDDEFKFGLPYSDQAIMDKLYELLPNKERVVMNAPLEHPEEIIEKLAQLNYIISMRLHALILSGLAGTQFIAVNYADKIARVMTELGVGDQVIPISALDSLEKVETTISKLPTLNSEKLKSSLSSLNSEALKNADIIKDIIKNAPRKRATIASYALAIPFLLINSLYFWLVNSKNPILIKLIRLLKRK